MLLFWGGIIMKVYRSLLAKWYFERGGRQHYVDQGLIDDKKPVKSAEEGYPMFIKDKDGKIVKIPVKIIR